MKHYFIDVLTINPLTYKTRKIWWVDWVSIFIVSGRESMENVWVIKTLYDCFHGKLCGPWNTLPHSFLYWKRLPSVHLTFYL